MFRTQTAVLIDGTVGQVTSGSTAAIVWQSTPFQDRLNEDGVVVETAEAQAKEAALDAIKSAEMEMFKPTTKKSRS